MRTVNATSLEKVAAAVFQAAGSDQREANLVAAHLVDANLVGHDSHGIIRVSRYITWLKAGNIVLNRHVEMVSDHGAAVVLDGGFGYGQVIGREASELLIDRARRHGFAAVAIRNSAHLGRIGAWAEQIAEAGLPSIHFVNTSGFAMLVAPYGGSDRRLSANPIAAGVPVPGRDPLVLDIATSIVAEGKIQVARNKKEQLPPGCLIDAAGRPTTDPEDFYATPRGAILPIAGHKGSGLSFFCEVLAGALTGGFASNPQSPTANRLVNNMLSLAFDPAAFSGADFFREDVLRLAKWVKASPPIEIGGEVLLPGEVEQRTRARRREKGIPLDDATIRQLLDTAKSLGVDHSEIEG